QALGRPRRRSGEAGVFAGDRGKVARRVEVRLGATVLAVVAVAALLGRVGADARWLAALGHVVSARGAVPVGIPFAVASTAHWHNPLVLAELVFGALGDRGLMVAQLAAVCAALVVLGRDVVAGGASAGGASAALVLAALGALPSLAIARVQMFSLLLFPVLVA